ncbi:MAG: hypothetical protein A2021_05625 [Elusimicrobia bacterium GWF2_52_66]|nr:MAG: hypothetical protein A2021_05625 [Elusimicrobia bacterium GWF2_52_66]
MEQRNYRYYPFCVAVAAAPDFRLIKAGAAAAFLLAFCVVITGAGFPANSAVFCRFSALFVLFALFGFNLFVTRLIYYYNRVISVPIRAGSFLSGRMLSFCVKTHKYSGCAGCLPPPNTRRVRQSCRGGKVD